MQPLKCLEERAMKALQSISGVAESYCLRWSAGTFPLKTLTLINYIKKLCREASLSLQLLVPNSLILSAEFWRWIPLNEPRSKISKTIVGSNCLRVTILRKESRWEPTLFRRILLSSKRCRSSVLTSPTQRYRSKQTSKVLTMPLITYK